jgi:hypothetical protein
MRYAITVALVISTPAIAGTFDATATSTGTRIDISLRSRSRADITLRSASEDGVVQYGGLTIDLAGASPCTLVFVDREPGGQSSTGFGWQEARTDPASSTTPVARAISGTGILETTDAAAPVGTPTWRY